MSSSPLRPVKILILVMRLTVEERETIKRTAQEVFGAGTEVYLFGSRTNDQKRGGDIDLFIRCHDKNLYTLENKVLFLTELKNSIGNQKIDVVFDNYITRQKKLFYNSIRKNMVVL